MIKMKDYQPKPFPWVSKSKLKDLDYCRYTFWLKHVQHIREKKRENAIEGTNMHMVFHAFFQFLKKEHVFTDEFTDPRTKLEVHPFRRFIYEGCMRFVKPKMRSWGKYKNIINNFATIECERFLRLNRILHDKDEIFKCFKPVAIEKLLEYEPTHMYGTIDRINIEVMPDKSKRIAIVDYKTGNVPSSVVNYYATPSDGKMFGCSLPSYYMKEIHFYGLLYLLKAGWQLHQRTLDFINNDEFFYISKDGLSYSETKKAKSKYLTDLKKTFKSEKADYKLFKDGKALKKGDILVGYYFLNGDRGYYPLKEFNYASLKSVLASINDYRTVRTNKFYITDPSMIYDIEACGYKNCHRMSQCEAEIKQWEKDHPRITEL